MLDSFNIRGTTNAGRNNYIKNNADLALYFQAVLDQIRKHIWHDLGINFEDISGTATTIHAQEEDTTDMKFPGSNIYDELAFMT